MRSFTVYVWRNEQWQWEGDYAQFSTKAVAKLVADITAEALLNGVALRIEMDF